MADVPSYIKKAAITDGGDKPEGSTEAELGAKLLEARLMASTHEEERKRWNVIAENIEKDLATLMESSKMDLFRSGGHTFFTQQENHPSVLAEDREAFHQWLKDNGHGAIVKEQVHYSTLKSWYTDQVKAMQPVPPMLKNYPRLAVRTRKSTKKEK